MQGIGKKNGKGFYCFRSKMLKRSEKLWMGSALFFGIFGLVCNLIGFSTPYWLQIWPR
jgi:hypothetical protein